MKKYLIIIAIVVVALIIISYYGDIAQENEKKRLLEESRREKQTESSGMDKLLNDIQYYEKHPELLITIDEAVQIYDSMWQSLDGYPFFGVAERIYGVNHREIWGKYLLEIRNKSGLGLLPPNINWFGDIIKRCIAEFKNLGYLEYADSYVNLQDNSIPGNSDNKIDDFNISHKILNDNAAYLKLQARSRGERQFEYDFNKILDFYDEIQGYENLIVDMTQYGGDDFYWKSLIVGLNIAEDIDIEYYFCAKDGVTAVNSLRFMFPDSYIGEIDMDLNLIPNINRDDLLMFDKLYKYQSRIYPSGEDENSKNKKMFQGNIYVLIDKNNNPATEDFAYFCKSTGFAEVVGRRTGALFSLSFRNNFQFSDRGWIISYMPLYLLNKDGSCNAEYGTEPDYPCEGRESPLDACLRIISPIPDNLEEHETEGE